MNLFSRCCFGLCFLCSHSKALMLMVVYLLVLFIFFFCFSGFVFSCSCCFKLFSLFFKWNYRLGLLWHDCSLQLSLVRSTTRINLKLLCFQFIIIMTLMMIRFGCCFSHERIINFFLSFLLLRIFSHLFLRCFKRENCDLNEHKMVKSISWNHSFHVKYIFMSIVHWTDILLAYKCFNIRVIVMEMNSSGFSIFENNNTWT